MRICHVMFYDKFVNEYIELINSYFDDNYFIVYKTPALNDMNAEVINDKNVLVLDNIKANISSLKVYFEKYDKVFIHGLFDRKLVIFLFFNKQYLKKANWIIWGGDLYYYKNKKDTLKSNLYEWIRKGVIKNFSEITALIKGDYDIAKEVYKTDAEYNYAFYPNPINFKFLDEALIQKNAKDNVSIQIGNSADPTNEHIEIIDILSSYKDKDIEIICPLSYGDKSHACKVKKYCNKIFSNNFKALTQYLLPEEYSKILANIDIAIFNHQRQQALGNIIGLLYLGKKVYIRSDITPWEYFNNMGVKLYDTKVIKNNRFEDLISFSENIGQVNRKIVRKEFSEEHCVELWRKVIEDKR